MGPGSLAQVGPASSYVVFPEPTKGFRKILGIVITVTCGLAAISAAVASVLVVMGLRFDSARGCFGKATLGEAQNIRLAWPIGALVISSVSLASFVFLGLGRLALRFIRWWVFRHKTFVFLALPLAVLPVALITFERTAVRISTVSIQVFAFPFVLAVLDFCTTLLDMPERMRSAVPRLSVRVACLMLYVYNMLQVAAIQAAALFSCPELQPDAAFTADWLLFRFETVIRYFVAVVFCAIYLRKFVYPSSPAVMYAIRDNVQIRWEK